MTSRLILVGLVCAAAGASSGARQPTESHFDLPRDSYLTDEVIPIVLTGVAPHAQVALSVTGPPGNPWHSSAVFVADDSGRVDVARSAPVRGGYSGIDPMGLFWSATRAGSEHASGELAGPSAAEWELSAEIDGQVVARASVKRFAVDPSVTVTAIRERGLVGTFYEPAGGGTRPAVLVLTGSGGGIPPPGGPAGGLASRGYAVLALAYFNAQGLPSSLSNIPLEYFGTALDWLASQPGVDRHRLAVVGASRGGELALVLGVVYSQIHAVVAYVPSNVVWPGCCDQSTVFAWTLHGQPLAAMPLRRRASPMEAARAEIQVEHIHGPILLVSGKDDGVWDSPGSANRIVDRLKRNRFAYRYEHVSYDHAGHAIGRPYSSTMMLNALRHPLTGNIMHLGGTPAGTAHASADSWPRVLAFLEESLAASSIPR